MHVSTTSKLLDEKTAWSPMPLIDQVYLECPELESNTDRNPQYSFEEEIIGDGKDLRICPLKDRHRTLEIRLEKISALQLIWKNDC